MSCARHSFCFNIHDLARGRVRGDASLLEPVARELTHYRAAAPGGELDLEVSLERLQDSRPLESGPVGWEGKHLAARWRANMSAAGAVPLRLAFQGNGFSRFIVSKWIVEPAARIVMEQKGAAMVHAAALSDGERAVLVAGPGGAGKTTWVLNWLSAGHPYMSDDFTLIVNAQALSYVTPMRLGLKNLLQGRTLAGLSAAAKAEIALRTLARRLSLNRLKLYYKALPETAIPGVEYCSRAELAGAIWIERGAQGKSGGITPEEMAALMAAVDRAEMHGFGKPGLLGAAHRSTLLSALQGKPCVSLPGPALPPAGAAASISALMDWASSPSAKLSW
jgi:hypothetical protein